MPEQPSYTPILDLESEPPALRKPSLWFRLILWLVCVAIGTGIGYGEDHKIFGKWPALNPLLFFVGLYLSLAVHEAGHLIAGAFAGLELGGIKVGPVLLIKLSGRWVFRLEWRTFGGGFYLPHVSSEQLSRTRAAAMIAGGPLANLLLAIGCLSLARNSAGLTATATGSLFWTSLLLFVGSIVPYRSGITRSDGARLLQILFDPEQARTWFALLAVQTENAQGVRPRDWNADLCTIAFRANADTPEYAYRQYLASYRALDQGSEESFLTHLENALAASSKCGKAFRHCLFLEAASASASLRNRAAQAASWYQRACAIRKPELAAPVEAAIAMAEGRYGDAIPLWRAAKAYVERRELDHGMTRLAREKWAEREAICIRALQQPVQEVALGTQR
ncbi:MAG TPA: M50 family metallopeptidase [Bryobacteraceae bacterium]|jgi:hypothetical protein|nr:M50 family metallopeptidase [Bryobacteraceae bacterium]